jgi:hypothetical protein
VVTLRNRAAVMATTRPMALKGTSTIRFRAAQLKPR